MKRFSFLVVILGFLCISPARADSQLDAIVGALKGIDDPGIQASFLKGMLGGLEGRRDVDPPADLKPFVPDFQPAVGDIDEFVKIPRPDGVADELGLRVLDEPKATQSDPDVLRLKLRRVLYTGSHTTPSAW